MSAVSGEAMGGLGFSRVCSRRGSGVLRGLGKGAVGGRGKGAAGGAKLGVGERTGKTPHLVIPPSPPSDRGYVKSAGAGMTPMVEIRGEPAQLWARSFLFPPNSFHGEVGVERGG